MEIPLRLPERKQNALAERNEDLKMERRKAYENDFSHRCLFPLVNEGLVQGELPSLVVNIVLLIRQVQLVGASLFVTSERIWGKPQGLGVEILRCFLDLGIHLCSRWIDYVLFQILYFVCVMGWVVWTISYYAKFQVLSEWRAQVGKYILFVISPLLTPIMAGWICPAFVRVVNDGTALNGLWLACIIVFVAALFTIDFFWMALAARSVVISGHLGAVWQPNVRLLTTILVIIGNMGMLLDLFPIWGQLFASLVMIAICVYMLYQLVYCPFLHFYVNIYFMWMLSFAILAEIVVMVVAASGRNLPVYVRVWIPLGVTFVVIAPLSLVFMVRRRRKIIAALNPQVTEGEERETKPVDFTCIAPTRVKSICSWMYLGLMNGCQYLLDRSFVDYIITVYDDTETKFAALQILCFFPGESSFIRKTLEVLDERDAYSYSWLEQSFLFQLRRLLVMRTGATKQFFVRLKDLKETTRESSQTIRTLWLDLINPKVKASFPVFKDVVDCVQRFNAQFVEASKRYPGIPQMCDAYAQFLIECAGDFETAVEWKWVEELLRLNEISNMDDSFQSFVNAFPKFIINEVISSEGGIRARTKSKGTELARTVSYALLTEDEVTYMGKKDVILEQSISGGKLRLAIQNSLKKARLESVQRLSCVLVLQAIAMPILFVLLLVFVPIISNKSIILMEELDYLTRMDMYTRYVQYVAALQIILKDGLYPGISQVVFDVAYDEDMANQWLGALAYPWMVTFDSINNIESSLTGFIDLWGTHQTDLESVRTILFESARVIPLFNGEFVAYNLNGVSQKQAILHFLDQCSLMAIAGNTDRDSEAFEQAALSVVFLGLSISDVFFQLSTELENFWTGLISQQRVLSVIVGLFVAAVCFFFFLVFNIYFLVRLHFEVNETISTLGRTRKETVEKSFLPISNQATAISSHSGSVLIARKQNCAFLWLFTSVLVSIIVPCIMILITFYLSYRESEEIQGYFYWHLWSARRASNILTAFTSALFLHRADTKTQFYIYFNQSMEALNVSQETLMSGVSGIGSFVGRDRRIDEAHLFDVCTHAANGTDLAGILGCNAIDKGVSYAQFLLSRIRIVLNPPEQITKERSYSEMIVYIDTGLMIAFDGFQMLIVGVVNDLLDRFDQQILLVSGIGIFVAPILVALVLIPLRYFKLAHEGMKQMIRFLPPEHILHSQALLAIVLGQSETSISSELMSPAQAVISTMGTPAIAVDKNEMVETVNSSFTSLTGLMRDQVVGQTIYMVLGRLKNSVSIPTDEIDSIQQIQRAVKTMKEGSKDRIATFYFQSVLDSGKRLQMEVLLIGNGKSQEFDGCDSFVLFLKDVTEFQEQKQQVKEAKRQTAELLEVIIPKEANRLLMIRHTDVVFTSDRATVIMVRIQPTSSVFSPNDTIESIRLFLEVCDQGIAQSQMLHTLHIWNDTYICVAGLFDSVYGSEEQVMEAVRFGTQVIAYQKTLAQQRGFPYEVSCGIAHGRLIGGIADPEALVFDISGEIVSVAEALASRHGINVNEVAKEVLGNTGFQFRQNNQPPVSYEVTALPQELTC